MSDYKNTYEIKVRRGNPTTLYRFRIWTEEALGGEWCLELDLPVTVDGLDTIFEPIGAHWSNGDARYFVDAPAAFAHIEEMIKEQEANK